MADTKITDLAAITGANTATGDLFPLVDVSDTTMAASGTDKKITRAELLNAFATAFIQTLLDDADAATARTTLGAQALDATLTALAGLATGANKLPYSTGTDTFSQADFIPGAWTAFTPTLAGGWLLGNSTYEAVYMQVGKLVAFACEITIGSTATKGTGLDFTLPVTAADAERAGLGLVASFRDTGTDLVAAAVGSNSTTVVTLRAIKSDTTYAIHSGVTATVPFTWATGDFIRVGGTYEAA